jgi:hypothetical protein
MSTIYGVYRACASPQTQALYLPLGRDLSDYLGVRRSARPAAACAIRDEKGSLH